MSPATILALLIFLVPPRAHTAASDEPAEDVIERYTTIATAMSEVCRDDKRLIMVMLASGAKESHWRRVIHTGEHRGDGGRSYGLWQRRASVPDQPSMRIKDTPYRFEHIVGLSYEATMRAAVVAAGSFGPMIERCHGDAYCVFKSYGGVKGTPRPKVEARLQERVTTYHNLMSRHAQAKKKRADKSQPASVLSFASAASTLVTAPHLGL